MSAEFALLVETYRLLDEAMEKIEEADPCLKCEYFQDVWHYPMGLEFPPECLGERCTREGGCKYVR